jgi:hypothetical protein
MNHCDGWPSKVIPLKIEGYSEGASNKILKENLGRLKGRDESLKSATFMNIDGRMSQGSYP